MDFGLRMLICLPFVGKAAYFIVRVCIVILQSRELSVWTRYAVHHFFAFESSNAFCRCRLFQFNVRLILSTQSSLRRSSGSTLGNGKRDAETVT